MNATRKRPHTASADTSRIFIAELVNSGLPIHIGAALLGHLNVQTTRGYVAVFDEDVIRHYQEHLEHRRQIRPTDEYRNTTSDEWTEFEEHFDRRKVELGSCGRPYGTPCQHEHACLTELILQQSSGASSAGPLTESDEESCNVRVFGVLRTSWLGQFQAALTDGGLPWVLRNHSLRAV